MDEKIKQQVDRLVRMQAKAYKLAAEQEPLLFTEIGRRTCDLLVRMEAITLADLVADFEKTVAESPSVRGSTDPDLDLLRMQAENAIKLLRSRAAPAVAREPSGSRKRPTPRSRRV